MIINYLIHHGVAELTENIDDRTNVIKVCTEPKCSGTITVGGHFFSLKNGEANIPKSAIKDGEYLLKIECDVGVFVAEGFRKAGENISVLPVSEQSKRRLIKRVCQLERNCDLLLERVARLEEMCQGHDIFNFERM